MGKVKRRWRVGALTALLVLSFARASLSDTGPQNPGVVEIQDLAPFSRVLAISDVHGEFQKLVALLSVSGVIDPAQSNRWIAGNTLLIVIGDSIDKGAQGLSVLDLWMSLADQAKADHGQVIHLLGNHEAEFLASSGTDKKANEFESELSAAGMTAEQFLSSPRGAYLYQMPLAARLGNWLFAHSGFFPRDLSWQQFVDQAKNKLSARNYGSSFITSDKPEKFSILEDRHWWGMLSGSVISNDIQNELKSFSRSDVHLCGVAFGHETSAFSMDGHVGAASIRIGAQELHAVKTDSGMPPLPEGSDAEGELVEFSHPLELAGDCSAATLPFPVVSFYSHSTGASPQPVNVLTTWVGTKHPSDGSKK